MKRYLVLLVCVVFLLAGCAVDDPGLTLETSLSPSLLPMTTQPQETTQTPEPTEVE